MTAVNATDQKALSGASIISNSFSGGTIALSFIHIFFMIIERYIVVKTDSSLSLEKPSKDKEEKKEEKEE